MNLKTNVEALILKHAPKAYRPLAQVIKSVLKEKEFVEFLESTSHLKELDFIEEVLKFFSVKVYYNGIENIQPNKRYIFVTNHPLGSLDGVALLGILNTFFPPTKAIVNELLLYIEGLKPYFVGVNVYGKFSKNQLSDLQKVLESSDNILVFPAGVVSIFRKFKIQDLPWKKSFVNQAINYNISIVPIYTDATNSFWFYLVATLRRFFRIKISLEAFMLPREIFRFKGRCIKFYFGKPIEVEEIKKIPDAQLATNLIREKVYSLRKQKTKPLTYFNSILSNRHKKNVL